MTRESMIRSLALSVHFRQPSFGMRKYEILSRASAFLLAVDPPKKENNNDTDDASTKNDDLSPYSHLKARKEERKMKELKRNYLYEPAGGPARDAEDLGWLEFCPKENRPLAHVIASSHVLSPWRWQKYYTQDWISQVTQDHCSYSLDVICPTKPDEPLAKFALNPYPIHHPNDMDMSIIHLKNENAALEHMMNLGVEMFHLRDPNEDLAKNEKVVFTGFEIAEESVTDKEDDIISFQKKADNKNEDDDTRVFHPYTADGSLLLFSPTRFIASTPSPGDDPAVVVSNRPLPQGLCGGPVIDKQNKVCGVVEGIVPIDHPETHLAGAAAFIPLHVVNDFVDWAERLMLEKIVTPELFEKIVKIKAGENAFPDEGFSVKGDPSFEESQTITKDVEALRNEVIKKQSKEEADAIFSVVEQEAKEVIDILKTEGGDMDEVVARVRERTRKKQSKMMQDLQNELKDKDDGPDTTDNDHAMNK